MCAEMPRGRADGGLCARNTLCTCRTRFGTWLTLGPGAQCGPLQDGLPGLGPGGTAGCRFGGRWSHSLCPALWIRHPLARWTGAPGASQPRPRPSTFTPLPFPVPQLPGPTVTGSRLARSSPALPANVLTAYTAAKALCMPVPLREPKPHTRRGETQ